MINTSTWTDSVTYYIKTKSYDFATNTQTVSTAYQFIVDRSSPTAYTTNPPDGATGLETLPTISGTANDTLPGAIDKVSIKIKKKADSTYWGNHGDATWEWGTIEDIWTSTSTPGLPTGQGHPTVLGPHLWRNMKSVSSR